LIFDRSSEKFIYKWSFGFFSDLAACLIFLLLLNFIFNNVRKSLFIFLGKFLCFFLFVFNAVNISIRESWGVYLNPKLSNAVNISDLLGVDAFKVAMSITEFNIVFFVAILPSFLIYKYKVIPCTINRTRHYSYIIYVLLFFLCNLSLRKLSGKFNSNNFPYRLSHTFYHQGLKEYVKHYQSKKDLSSKERVEITDHVRENIKKHFTNNDFLRPYPKYPMFKMGKTEYCLITNMYKTHKDCEEKTGEKIGGDNLKNIIFIALESFQGISFDGLSPFFSGITPRLSKHMKSGAWFSRAFAPSLPTARALGALFCSFPGMSPAISELGKTDLVCLPDILNGLNYHGARFVGNSENFAKLGDFYRHHGVKEVYGKHEIWEKYKVPKNNSGAFADISGGQLINVVKDWIYNFKKEKPKQPFFLIIETLSTHAPFDHEMLNKYNYVQEGAKFKDTKSWVAIHRSMRYTDDVISDFLDWTKTEESNHLLDDTIVVVLADHPSWSQTHFKKFPINIKLAWIPFFILGLKKSLNKKYEFPVVTYDIAPSLLWLLGITPPNAFIGKNFFKMKKNSFGTWSFPFFVSGDNIFLKRDSWQGGRHFKFNSRMQLTPIGEHTGKVLENLFIEYKSVYKHMTDSLQKTKRYLPENFQVDFMLNRLYSKK